MVYAPHSVNSMLGRMHRAVIFRLSVTMLATPFAVVVIPVDDKLAIKAQH